MIASAAPDKPKSTPRRLRLRTLINLVLLLIVILMLIPTLQILAPAIAYRDDLIALLNYSEDCKAPCFMGITPGVTTIDKAYHILENHEWVESVRLNRQFEDGKNFSWKWSGKQPDYLDSLSSDADAMIYLSADGTIMLALATPVSFAGVLLNLGTPEAMIVNICSSQYIYPEQDTVIETVPSNNLLSKLQGNTVFYMGYPPGPHTPFVLMPDDCSGPYD